MYKVYCDDLLLYHSTLDNLKIFNPSIELELNKTGSFEFIVHTDHPYYNLIKKLKSVIAVYQDDYLLFRGRVLDDEIGWHNEKLVICEGDMAFLLDSIQRPMSFNGTVAEFLAHIINGHNSQVEPAKRFTLGTVTVDGTLTAEMTEFTNSLETVQKRLLDGFGGYLRTRQVNGINYLDYLDEINLLSPQTIKFGKNLLDLKRIRKGSDIASAIIPLGEDGLTITSVNDGLDYILDEDAKAQFGFIVKPIQFEGVTDARELLLKGQSYLSSLVKQMESIELSAADLATVDKTVTSFHIGTQVRVTSDPHGLNQLFTVSKLSIKLLDPAANRLVLGKTISTFSESVVFKKGDPGRNGQDGSPGTPGAPGSPGRDGKDGLNGKDGVSGKDGVGVLSIIEQYYLSTSATSLAGGSWSGTVPTWVDGRFMWTRSVITYTNNTTSNTSPKCVTGAKGSTGTAGSPGAAGKDGISITKVDVMYYQSTSSTALSGGSWVTTAPAWVNGRFFWEKTGVTYSDGTIEESKPVCITGQQGSQGPQGTPGANGAPGAKGDKGDPGANGKDGTPGKDGVNGKDGKDAAVQSLTAPSDTSFLWLDISVDPPLLKRYDPETATWKIVNDVTEIVYNLEHNFKSEVERSETTIRESMYENVYLKDDVNGLVSETSAHWERTAKGFEMEFVKINKDVEDVANGVDAEFEEIRKYIRYIDGQILLGEVGNELELKIANDRISFLQDGAEVAYFSNRKLFVTDAEILHSMKLGNFAFMPRANGNLSFKKTV